MTIELLKEYDGYAVGTVLTLPSEKEAQLVANNTAVGAPTPPANAPAPARKAEPLAAPKALTVPESLKALRGHIVALQGQLARGSKSDLDQVGARLAELVAWVDALLDDKHHNPSNVNTIAVDPVAQYAADKAAADKKAAGEKAEHDKAAHA